MKSFVILMLIGCVAAGHYKPQTSTLVRSETKLDISTYQLYTTPKPLFYAKVLCYKLGGELATINTPQEHEFLTKLLKKYKVNHAWVGLHDTVKENHFVWFRGNLNGGYKKWCKNEPNNYKNGEDCVELTTAHRCLNDLNCSSLRPFICEINDWKRNVSYF